MERADKVGFGVAAGGHVLLFAILSLGLVSTARLPPPHTEPIDVQLVDLIGLRSAAPKAAPEPPAQSVAPTEGPPEDAAPPPADAVPPPPEPKPVAPPSPKPVAEKLPVEKPAVKPAPKPEPKPVPPKPAPKPEPKPQPKPLPPKPQKDVRAEKAAAEKVAAQKAADQAAAEKAAAVKAAAAKAAADKTSAQKAAAAKTKAATDRAAAVKAAVAEAAALAKGEGAKGSKSKATGSRLGADFLRGLKADKATGKAAAPAAATVSDRAMAGLAAAIKRQVEPCYELGSLQGTDAMQIVTTLRLRFNKDGSTANAPTITGQTGVNGDNRAYARQIGEVAKRAVLRCSPLRLPAELYEGGWEDLELVFTPGQMG